MQITLQFRPTVLNFLLLVNIIFYLLSIALAVLLFTNLDQGYRMVLSLDGALTVNGIAQGEIWRLIMSTYLHILSPLHLLTNMIGLWQLGMMVVEYYGGKWLFIFYTLCGIAGGLASLPFLGNAGTVGASGAIYGLVGVFIGASYQRRQSAVDIEISSSEIMSLLFVMLLLTITPGINANLPGHLGGLVAGIALGLIVPHKLIIKPSKAWGQVEKWGFRICLLVLAASVVCAIINFTTILEYISL
jgi:rhomboid protease GluP